MADLVTQRPLHSLLHRQLKRHWARPVPPELFPLLAAISEAYYTSDQDRSMLERSMDISGEELHRAISALRASERQFRSLVDQAADAGFLHDLDGRLVHVNRQACESLGYERAELLRLSMAEVEVDAGPERLAGLWKGLSPGHPVTLEGVHRRKDGSLFPVETRIGVLDEGGLVLALSRDVTERQRAESELRAAQRYALLFESNPQPMFVYAQQTLRLLAVNAAAVEGYGRSREELLAATLDDLRAPGAERGGPIAPAERHRRQAGTFEVETASHGIVFDGELARIVLAVDVTERRRADEALRTSEYLLSESQRIAHLGSWEWDAARGTVWSDERYRILGLAPQSEPASFELLLSLVHPEDRGRLEALTARTREAPGPFEIDYRIVRRDGTVRWVRARLHRISESPERWFGIDQDVTELREAEAAMKRSEERYRTLFQRNLAGVYRSTLDGRLLECNDTFARIYGWSSAEEMRGERTIELYPEPADRQAFLEKLRRDGALLSCETLGRRRDGRPLWTLENVGLVEDEGETVLEGTLIDITDRRALESQLLQAQKMEAVGRLAGGVAHDFNNYLTAISGCSELLLAGGTLAPQQQRLAETVHKASQKAAAVTRQLLAFSRKTVLVPRILDLSEVLAGVEGLLRRMIGEDIRLVTVRGRRLGSVRADRAQLEQVIVNLAVNARDAMPDGGTLTLETGNAEHGNGPDRPSAPDLAPGPHVVLSVSDTGTGMGDEVKAHLFEPFFTTKEPGKGTGLGLAMVYGIVKQSGGAIAVESEPGKGSTFRIYLPRWSEAAVVSDEHRLSEPAAHGGSETLLLVEDDDLLRGVTRSLLEARGYSILEARHPGEALLMAERHSDELRLVITDVVMPHMNGLELAKRLRALSPVPALFMSGYTDDGVLGQEIRDGEIPFLQKPFTGEALARKVREMLDRA